MNETDTYVEWAAPASWRHAVNCLWEQRVATTRAQRVVPDGHADLIFHNSGAVHIVGVADTVDLPSLQPGMTIRGIRLRTAAVGPALRVAASSLRNQTLAAEDVLGSRLVRRLAQRDRLDSWVHDIRPIPEVEGAVHLLGDHSVEDVADELAVSSRQLRRLLLHHVGVGPKTLQQICRLQRFVRATDGGVPLATAAADAGYADQAHLTRDVKRFAGVTPARLVRERR